MVVIGTVVLVIGTIFVVVTGTVVVLKVNLEARVEGVGVTVVACGVLVV